MYGVGDVMMDRLKAWVAPPDSHKYSALPDVNGQDVHEKETTTGTQTNRNRSLLKVVIGAVGFLVVLYFVGGYM